MGIKYDPFDHYAINYDALYQCGKDQGIDIRPQSQGGDIQVGDMLFVRSGWTKAYWNMAPEERVRMRGRFAGLKQEEKILDWLHDCYFAAVAGDGQKARLGQSEHRS